MSAPKINTPVGVEERQPVEQVEEAPAAGPSLVVTPEEQAIDEPLAEGVVEANMEDEKPFTSEELVPSFWSIEACGNGITATHRNGRIFRGTTKQFSGMLKA